MMKMVSEFTTNLEAVNEYVQSERGAIPHVLTSQGPGSKMKAAYAGSPQFGVGSGIGTGGDKARARRHIKAEDSFFTRVRKKTLLDRARARRSLGDTFDRISASISMGIRVR